jgi:CheY-like chemotaxis protein
MPDRIRVLLVNRARDEREMYAECLQRQGYCTLQAATAADAYRLATELPPAVVVTGVKLAGPDDGLTLTRRLRAHEITRSVPVVMLTGYVFAADQEAAIVAGCTEFVAKPCLPDTLASVIGSIVVPRAPHEPSQNAVRPNP